ncbi:SIS domain-containing protein [Occultella glacieicola]|uniref:SIS domain-containing protein n=1 Tax=Occultella glacieicola TaxID=2518684 RepID=A0ABY2E9N1_9MICO|nr:SIS domain-containing protein [Occultella glacieicola]TDE95002.1 SIS domain-containing protein [Occultella glacieicola]
MTDQHTAAAALGGLAVPDITPLGGRRAAFLGCGDSLAAARGAEADGHRVLSAGDVAWSGSAPRGVDLVVPLSWSGRTGATIRAAQVAKDAGLPVLSITSNPASPLAELSDEHIALPPNDIAEDIPAIGYALHSSAIARLVGLASPDPATLARDWADAGQGVARVVTAAGGEPAGITIASMPDAHGAAEFWMLKIIEATGITVRTASIEEIGHVDYFLGPQAHLTLIVSGAADAPRADGLGAALGRNGQRVVQIRLSDFTAAAGTEREILGGLIGADVAAGLAVAWGRPHFRGGVVDMSAQHIQVPVA